MKHMQFCNKGNYMTKYFAADNIEIKLIVSETEDIAQIVLKEILNTSWINTNSFNVHLQNNQTALIQAHIFRGGQVHIF